MSPLNVELGTGTINASNIKSIDNNKCSKILKVL